MFWKKDKKEIVNLKKYKPFFVTNDGAEHEGCNYKWLRKDGFVLIPVYLMNESKSDGYMIDNNFVMYLMDDVKSVEWKLIAEKKVILNSRYNGRLKFDDDEVDNMEEYKTSDIDDFKDVEYIGNLEVNTTYF